MDLPHVPSALAAVAHSPEDIAFSIVLLILLLIALLVFEAHCLLSSIVTKTAVRVQMPQEQPRPSKNQVKVKGRSTSILIAKRRPFATETKPFTAPSKLIAIKVKVRVVQ